jgi:hypothetical protein
VRLDPVAEAEDEEAAIAANGGCLKLDAEWAWHRQICPNGHHLEMNVHLFNVASLFVATHFL